MDKPLNFPALERCSLYKEAAEEIDHVMMDVPEDALVMRRDVRTLMIAAWLRGVGFKAESH